jgi:hypothetical protein
LRIYRRHRASSHKTLGLAAGTGIETAAVFLQDLMETQVRDDWDEFYEEAQQNKKEAWRRKREAQKQEEQGQ